MKKNEFESEFIDYRFKNTNNLEYEHKLRIHSQIGKSI